ncbi:MAG: TIGR03013 family PEP-CTERM/XrtA system glycosyltransferase [Acidobacteriaceae bacterium]|nr:TIGR03013 family PEP-CTERM/XrtA system glycosyltransferase [Acidobacteriaceae bacterium]
MIRIFNVYYPTRTLVLLLCEALLIGGSFLLATMYLLGPDAYIALFYENGVLKILCITILTLLLSYYFDLYEPQRISGHWEIYFRLLLVLSVLSFIFAALLYLFPVVDIGRNVLVVGISILTVALIIWRSAYEWIIGLSAFRERVYILGNGERARVVIETLRSRRDAGMKIVNAETEGDFKEDIERFAADLRSFRKPKPNVDRIIVAMENRRGSMPVRELLDLRLRGVVIEDASILMERLLGRLPLDGLNPSSLIFTHGFNVKASQQIVRRLVSIFVSFVGLVLCLPIIPFIILAVRLSSPGPILFRQTRVGLRGRPFSVIKFRTMRQDAEAKGAVWATKNDPRVTSLGRFMRKTRLDEIPQLWNVLRGEMGFVGPRPERPEFVQWLNSEIPFYELRHIIRPGITGWAQVRYQYGASLEETRRKLEYDLYYVKHLSIGLDLLIMFETIKTIILRRGAQ